MQGPILESDLWTWFLFTCCCFIVSQQKTRSEATKKSEHFSQMTISALDRCTSLILQPSTKTSFLLAYVQILFTNCTRYLLFVSQQLLSAAGGCDVVGPAGPSLSQLRLESLTLTCSLAGVEGTGGNTAYTDRQIMIACCPSSLRSTSY